MPFSRPGTPPQAFFFRPHLHQTDEQCSSAFFAFLSPRFQQLIKERGGRGLGCTDSTTPHPPSMINCHLEVKQLNLNADGTRTLPLPLVTRFRIPSLRVLQSPTGIHPRSETKTRNLVFCLPMTDKITLEVRQNPRETRAISSLGERAIVIL